jgi:hypothetical protein
MAASPGYLDQKVEATGFDCLAQHLDTVTRVCHAVPRGCTALGRWTCLPNASR